MGQHLSELGEHGGVCEVKQESTGKKNEECRSLERLNQGLTLFPRPLFLLLSSTRQFVVNLVFTDGEDRDHGRDRKRRSDQEDGPIAIEVTHGGNHQRTGHIAGRIEGLILTKLPVEQALPNKAMVIAASVGARNGAAAPIRVCAR